MSKVRREQLDLRNANTFRLKLNCKILFKAKQFRVSRPPSFILNFIHAILCIYYYNTHWHRFKAKQLNMVQPDSQWLYLIVDSIVRNSSNITNFADLLSEGGNVAFIYNATDSDTQCDVFRLYT